VPEKTTDPPPLPCHLSVKRQVPAISSCASAEYLPATPVGFRSTVPNIGMPVIGIVALPLTGPTSTSAPSVIDLNSTTNVSLPCRTVPALDRRTTSTVLDRTR